MKFSPRYTVVTLNTSRRPANTLDTLNVTCTFKTDLKYHKFNTCKQNNCASPDFGWPGSQKGTDKFRHLS